MKSDPIEPFLLAVRLSASQVALCTSLAEIGFLNGRNDLGEISKQLHFI